MKHTLLTRRPSALSLAGLLLLVTGCGLKNYEEQMLQTQAKLKRFEEESKLLDGELRFSLPAPTEKGAPQPPVIFLRPPKGIQPTASNEKEPRNRILYTFPSRGLNAAGVFHNVEVGVGDKSKDFDGSVLSSFSVSGDLVRVTQQKNPPNRAPITFKRIDFDDGQFSYSVNFWAGPENQVAIVYTYQRGQKERAAKAMDASLESFAIGNEVLKARMSLGDPLRANPSPRR